MKRIIIDADDLHNELRAWLNTAYYCTRVWEAWNYGTMGEEDFCSVDIDEIVSDIDRHYGKEF